MRPSIFVTRGLDLRVHWMLGSSSTGSLATIDHRLTRDFAPPRPSLPGLIWRDPTI
jgi:hypothetical protein